MRHLSDCGASGTDSNIGSLTFLHFLDRHVPHLDTSYTTKEATMSIADGVEQSEFRADHIGLALPRQFDYNYDGCADQKGGLSSTYGVIST